MANAPRSYREAIAEAIRASRPEVDVEDVEPEDLERALWLFRPDMVVCCRAPESVRSRVPIWVELYPDNEGRAVVGSGWGTQESSDLEFQELLGVVDQASRLARGD